MLLIEELSIHQDAFDHDNQHYKTDHCSHSFCRLQKDLLNVGNEVLSINISAVAEGDDDENRKSW